MFKINFEIIKFLRLILEKELHDLQKENITSEQQKELIKTTDKFLTYRLDREIKSRRFIVKNSH